MRQRNNLALDLTLFDLLSYRLLSFRIAFIIEIIKI